MYNSLLLLVVIILKIQELKSSVINDYRDCEDSRLNLLKASLFMQGMSKTLDDIILASSLPAFSDYRSPGVQQSDIGIGFTNGIANSIDLAMSHTDYIHSLAQGYSVELFYNPTNGMFSDIYEVLFGDEVDLKAVDQLKEAWYAFDEANKDNPEAKYLQICHSQGGVYVKRALQECPKEIRDRIIVVNIAIAVIIPGDLCYQSYNYASKNDYINLLDMMRAYDPDLIIGFWLWAKMFENREEIIWLEGSTGPWWMPGILYQLYYMDHEFQDPIFNQVIAERIADYLENY